MEKNKNDEQIINDFTKTKMDLIISELKKYFQINELMFMDIYDNFIEQLNNMTEQNYLTIFTVVSRNYKIKDSKIDYITFEYKLNHFLPISFIIRLGQQNTISLLQQSPNIPIFFDTLFSKATAFEKSILCAYILNNQAGYYEINTSNFYNICKNTFSDSRYFQFLMYIKYQSEKKINGSKIILPSISPVSKKNILVLGNLYCNLLSSQFSLKKIHQFYDSCKYEEALIEIDNIGTDIILSRGDYFLHQFQDYKEYYYKFNDYFWNLFNKIKKLKIKTSIMAKKFAIIEEEKLNKISLIDQFIEIDKLLNNILFYSSLLLILSSPFFKTLWRFYSKVLFYKLSTIFENCSIQKIIAQRKPLSKATYDKRMSEDGTTRLQFFFRLEGNYDLYMLRIDLAHEGVPFIHFNLEETSGNSMTSSGIPVGLEIAEVLSEDCINHFLYKCSDKYWFKTNFEKNYADYADYDKSLIKSIFEKQCHYNIYLNSENEFCEFINEINNILRLYCSSSFFDFSFNNDKEGNSDYLSKIRKKDSIIIKLNALFKDAELFEDVKIEESCCNLILELLADFY